jgi:HAMP domain-containing protein
VRDFPRNGIANQRGEGEKAMNKVLVIPLVALSLVWAGIFSAAPPALAQRGDDEIHLLKEMLRDLERQKDAEIENLRRRIEALERDRAQRQAPSHEIGELQQSVTELKSEVEEQRSLYERLGRFLQDHKFKAGLRMQSWYQFVEDGEKAGEEDLHDFMVRRFYFYLKGEVMPRFGFFAHIAADRIGQDGLDKASVGLGSSIAVRDAWIYYDFHEAFKVQLGRYYIPFTRNYGTTSTFAMLPLELPFNQGGVRGGIFYASKVGRDDGVVF